MRHLHSRRVGALPNTILYIILAVHPPLALLRVNKAGTARGKLFMCLYVLCLYNIYGTVLTISIGKLKSLCGIRGKRICFMSSLKQRHSRVRAVALFS